MTERKQISLQKDDTQAALDAFPDGMNYQGQYVWDWFTKNSTTIRAALDRIIAEATPSTDALKILRHVNNWSEIETAPKDGTEILLGRFEDGVIEDIIKDYWYEDRVMAAWAEYPAVFDNSPTHWARLPLLLGCSAPKRRDDTQAALDEYQRDEEVAMKWDGFRAGYYTQPKQSAPVERIEGLAEAIDVLEAHMADMGDMAVVLVAARAYLKLQGGD